MDEGDRFELHVVLVAAALGCVAQRGLDEWLVSIGDAGFGNESDQRRRVVTEARADGSLPHDRDAEAFEDVARADAGADQDRRRLDGAGREDDARRVDRLSDAAGLDLEAGGLTAGDDDANDVRIWADHKVRPLTDGH